MFLKQDHFLSGILIGIGLLIAAAVSLFFLQRDSETYSSAAEPQDVVRNFALAIYRQDYSRAYEAMADLPGKPTYIQFRQAYLNEMSTNRSSLEVGQVIHQTGREAVVEVRVSYSRGGIFSSSSKMTESATLERGPTGWKITSLPYPFWQWGWLQSTPMKIPPP